MPKADILNRLTAAFPDLSYSDVKFIDEGWDHEVLILDDKLVFRFPTDDEYRDKLKHEIELLEYLRPRVPVTLPQYTHIAPDKDFAGYPIVPGEELTRERFDDLSDDANAVFTRQLAGFLSAIHLLDVKDPALANIPASRLREEQKEVRKLIPKLAKELSIEDLELVSTFMAEVDEVTGSPVPHVFTHGDVYSRHLIWDDEHQQLGIIDFGDMAIGDPALDFAELHEYGADFVRHVYELYAGHRDDYFLTRAWTYQKWAAVYMLTDHLEHEKTSFKVARETFDRVKRQLADR
jgi:aminoglycoside 2''-phosphotransferase